MGGSGNNQSAGPRALSKRGLGGAGSLGQNGINNSEGAFAQVVCYGDFEELIRYNLEM